MKSHLKNLININGPIPLSQFIYEALFHNDLGYYNQRNPFGKEGDFITAPEISQVFGELIGAYLLGLWQNNYDGGKINLVEMGAGRGTLMKDLLNFAKKIPYFLERFNISIIEVSPKLQEIQKHNLQEFTINYYNNFTDFYQNYNDCPIFFVANELFDCFPIDQLIKTENGWAERLVGIGNNDELSFVLGQKVDNSFVDELLIQNLECGSVFEYSLQGYAFMNDLSIAIKRTKGIGLIIDYGYMINEFRNTLQAIKNHKFCDVLQEVGWCDITALVDFFALKNIAIKNNLQTSLITQKEFLGNIGIEVRRVKLLAGKDVVTQKTINSAIDRLIDQKQMGELFKALIIW